jgi:hypothetical protein
MHAFDYINDIYGDIFKVLMKLGLSKSEIAIIGFACDINIEHPELTVLRYFYDPDDFNTVLSNS